MKLKAVGNTHRLAYQTITNDEALTKITHIPDWDGVRVQWQPE